MTAALGKMQICRLLAERHRLTRFLEISTPTTGQFFDVMGDASATLVHRLVYNCPAGADDGRPYTYRTEQPVSHALTQAILAANGDRPCYDLIFVDPFHSYAGSSIDLSGAFALLEQGGIIVVHDCNPPNAMLATPVFRPDGWCGITYAAFIDFTLRRKELSFYTVDTDFGCGVIHKHPARTRIAQPADDRLAFAWDVVRHDDTTRFAFFETHREKLLNLKSIDEFYALEGLPPAP